MSDKLANETGTLIVHVLLAPLVIMLCWNYCIAEMLQMPTWSFGQALVVKLFVGSVMPGRLSNSHE